MTLERTSENRGNEGRWRGKEEGAQAYPVQRSRKGIISKAQEDEVGTVGVL